MAIPNCLKLDDLALLILSDLNGLDSKVWPLTQFFSVSFLWKIIDLPGGQINDPSWEKQYSLPFLLETPLSLSRTFEGLFELTWRPSRALDLPRALLLELQRYKDTVRCAALGTEVPGHCQEQLSWRKPWLQECVCWKRTFIHQSLIVKIQQNRIELVTRPGGN